MISQYRNNIPFGKIKCQIIDKKGNQENIEFKDKEKVCIDRLENKVQIYTMDHSRLINAKSVSVCFINRSSELHIRDFTDSKDSINIQTVQQGGLLFASSSLNKTNPGISVNRLEKDGMANFFNFHGKIQRIEEGAKLEVWAGSSADVGLNAGTIDVKSLDSTAKSSLKLGTNKGTLEVDKDNPQYSKFLSKVRICKNLGNILCSKSKNDIVIKDGNKEIKQFPSNLADA